MTDNPTEQASYVFGCLNGMIRTAALYPPMHALTVKAKQTLHDALTGYLSTHGRLVYRFLGDVLVADDRILPRESLLYRQFLAVCQNERQIGSISFVTGVELREVDALLEAVTRGVGDEPSAWVSHKGLTHVLLGPPIQPEQQSGETTAKRAYYGSIDALRDIQATIRARAPLAVEQMGTLRVFTSTLLDQILQSPALVLRLASIKSYDEYTLYHSVNVAVISIGLGLVIGLPEPLLREVAMSGMLHDVGKIAIPLEILRKPGPLDEEEWQIMRRHPVLGADLLSRLPGSNRLPMIVAFEHHIRFDRRGYPSVATGWAQHPVSRLACVADVFDAMTSRRAYKKAIPNTDVRGYVRDEAGRTFDPRLVRVLDLMLGQLEEATPEEGRHEGPDTVSRA
jgi:HD-GYP domain-containing protein (c-di-GMP phosphodiesterase class II)